MSLHSVFYKYSHILTTRQTKASHFQLIVRMRTDDFTGIFLEKLKLDLLKLKETTNEDKEMKQQLKTQNAI